MEWLRFEIPRLQQKRQESFILRIPSQINAANPCFLPRSQCSNVKDFVVDLGDGQVWSQSVPNRMWVLGAVQICSDVDRWEFREHPGTRNIDIACIYTYICKHTPHTCMYIMTTENVSQENPMRPQKTKQQTATSIVLYPPWKKIRTFPSSGLSLMVLSMVSSCFS